MAGEIAADLVRSRLDQRAQREEQRSRDVQTDVPLLTHVGIQVSDGFDIDQALAEVTHEHELRFARLKSAFQDRQRDLETATATVEALRAEAGAAALRHTASANELAEGAVANEVLRLTLADTERNLAELKRTHASTKSDLERSLRERDALQERLVIKANECTAASEQVT